MQKARESDMDIIEEYRSFLTIVDPKTGKSDRFWWLRKKTPQELEALRKGTGEKAWEELMQEFRAYNRANREELGEERLDML
jgi:hypothetical protein